MVIKDVKMVVKKAVKPGTKQDGLPVPSHPEIISFVVDVDQEDGIVVVPNDPLNANYKEVADWYAAQKSKPFKFKFEPLGD